MDLSKAMEVLGIQRSIWIDDYFEEKKSDLFTMLSENKDIAQSLNFPELPDSPSEFDPDAQLLAKFIEALDEPKKKELEDRFLEQQSNVQGTAVRELSNSAIQRTSELLKVQSSDRVTFKAATAIIPALCREGDSAISYVVDLSDGNVDAHAGLETLFHLSNNSSKGIIFILTHEATPENEASLEVNLRHEYQRRHQTSAPPICVISKGRIDGAENDASLEEELKIALKRAGLRRGVHGVLGIARGAVSKAFEQATSLLLEIPPEQLDKFMVERAFNEGVSELHVVERALCASLADEIRSLFMAENSISQQVKRLRTFRSITLKPGAADKPHDSLEGFRRLEIWEPSDMINSSFSPITCGDVFTLDGWEFPANDFVPKRFLLLGQQCDLQMRPTGQRAQSYAYLVPLLEVDEGAEQTRENEVGKTKLLPFRLDSKKWRCDFRNATQVRLSILDLASFRQDGRVAFWQSQVDSELPAMLLPGLEKTHASITTSLKEVLAKPPSEVSLRDVRCQLTFSSEKPFSRFSTAMFKKAGKATIRGEKITHEARVTWCIRREGRIRMPYAASLLRDFLAVSGRDAFDIDFVAT